MRKLVIHGNEKYCKEIEDLFVNQLGITNSKNMRFDDFMSFFTITDNKLEVLPPAYMLDKTIYAVYMYEEFVALYPFVKGDKVMLVYDNNTKLLSQVTGMRWSRADDCIMYKVVNEYGETECKVDNLRQLCDEEILDEIEKEAQPTNTIDVIRVKDVGYSNQILLELPEDTELVYENGKHYIRHKADVFPKTFDECDCLLLLGDEKIDNWKKDMFEAFERLIKCRDAYWKLANWAPVNDGTTMYSVVCMHGTPSIQSCTDVFYNKRLFCFPTETMAKQFMKNFMSDLELCKELF